METYHQTTKGGQLTKTASQRWNVFKTFVNRPVSFCRACSSPTVFVDIFSQDSHHFCFTSSVYLVTAQLWVLRWCLHRLLHLLCFLSSLDLTPTFIFSFSPANSVALQLSQWHAPASKFCECWLLLQSKNQVLLLQIMSLFPTLLLVPQIIVK